MGELYQTKKVNEFRFKNWDSNTRRKRGEEMKWSYNCICLVSIPHETPGTTLYFRFKVLHGDLCCLCVDAFVFSLTLLPPPLLRIGLAFIPFKFAFPKIFCPPTMRDGKIFEQRRASQWYRALLEASSLGADAMSSICSKIVQSSEVRADMYISSKTAYELLVERCFEVQNICRTCCLISEYLANEQIYLTEVERFTEHCTSL